jgi:hypothetical protein
MLTLKKIRFIILKDYQSGLDKQDRKTSSGYWDELIFQARAQLLPELYSSSGIDPEWLQVVPVTLQKLTDSVNGVYYQSTTALPDIVALPNDIGFYRIKNNSKGIKTIIQFEHQNPAKAGLAKYDRMTGHRTKVCRVGSQLEIKTKVPLALNIEVNCVCYNPYQVTGFTEDSLFPFSETAIEQLKAIVYKLDLATLLNSGQQPNDSQEQPNSPQKQAGQ